jgi:hypothetical protein
VEGWINAANLRLTQTDLDELALAIQQTGAGTGPASPKDQGFRTREVA